MNNIASRIGYKYVYRVLYAVDFMRNNMSGVTSKAKTNQFTSL